MARSSTEKEKAAATSTLEAAPTLSHDAGPINASGHTQELQRNFGIFSIIGLAITSGNIWIALGGTLVVALGNGGPPGTVYELCVRPLTCHFFHAVANRGSSDVTRPKGLS